ncbi:MAG: hypothetical protein U0X40_04360 [Ferruginibacter sp.]
MTEKNSPVVISVQVPLAPSFVSSYCTIRDTSTRIDIPLIDGTHTITTIPVPIGQYRNAPDLVIEAKICFWYEYDAAASTLTLCGNDLVAEQAMSLISGIKGSAEYCRQYTAPQSQRTGTQNPAWNYFIPSTPELESLLRQSLREANTLIIEEAKKKDINVIVLTPPPSLEKDLFEKLHIVYQNGQFLELFNPSKTYGPEHTVVNILSVWGGEIYLHKYENFANVIGSTGDKKIAGLSWLQLWQNQFGQAHTCASLDYLNFPCYGGLVGGHVILGKQARWVPYGANYVFIIPICTAHNNDDNVYMAAVQIGKGIALKNYHNP